MGGDHRGSPAPRDAGSYRPGAASRAQSSCMPLHGHPFPYREAIRGQGAKRRHQPTGARGEAGAHRARQGPAAAQRRRRHRKRRGKARREAATAREAGAQSEPPAPRLKNRIRGATAPDGGRGGGEAARGEGGEPPRRQDAGRRRRDRSSAQAQQQGAGRSARRRQDGRQQPATEAASVATKARTREADGVRSERQRAKHTGQPDAAAARSAATSKPGKGSERGAQAVAEAATAPGAARRAEAAATARREAQDATAETERRQRAASRAARRAGGGGRLLPHSARLAASQSDFQTIGRPIPLSPRSESILEAIFRGFFLLPS